MNGSTLLQLGNPHVPARNRLATTPATKRLKRISDVMWCPLLTRPIRQRDEPGDVWTEARTVHAMKLRRLPN